MATLIDLNTKNDIPNSFILEDSEALKQAILSFVNTSPGDFLFEPDLGSSIIDYLFSPVTPTTQADLEFILNDQLSKHFSFLNITAKVLINNSQLTINIAYTDIFTGEKEIVSLDIE